MYVPKHKEVSDLPPLPGNNRRTCSENLFPDLPFLISPTLGKGTGEKESACRELRLPFSFSYRNDDPGVSWMKILTLPFFFTLFLPILVWKWNDRTQTKIGWYHILRSGLNRFDGIVMVRARKLCQASRPLLCVWAVDATLTYTSHGQSTYGTDAFSLKFQSLHHKLNTVGLYKEGCGYSLTLNLTQYITLHLIGHGIPLSLSTMQYPSFPGTIFHLRVFLVFKISH